MNAGTRCAFLGGGKLSGSLIQRLPRHGVAASQRIVRVPSAPQRLGWHAEFGFGATAGKRVAVRETALWLRVVTGPGGTTGLVPAALAAAGFDRLVSAGVVAATVRAAQIAARGGQPGQAARWE